MRHLERYDPEFRQVTKQEHSGPDGAAIEIELLEKERVVLTGFVQKLVDHGWTVKLALQHLKEMSIPEEKLKLIRGEDLLIPERIDVESGRPENGTGSE